MGPPPYRMPAEWEPHTATWIAWPHRAEDWPGKFETIPPVFAAIARHLHHSERVRILINNAEAERRVARLLREAGVNLEQIDFFPIPTDRAWTRDYGPMLVQAAGDDKVIVDWRFSAWAKYPEWQNDDRVARAAAEALGLRHLEPRLGGRRVVLEGGAIDVNGEGLLLTTEECLLSPVQERNPGLGRDEMEVVLREYLGVRKVLWLGRGIAGDDTHGHIDDVARFVGPRTVVVAVEDDPADPNHEPLQDNLRRLSAMTDAEGKPLEVVPLPMPAPVSFEGQRLPASYANFYVANRCVLVPTFNGPSDREALAVLAGLFPGREVIGVDAVDLVWGLGTLHCLTQQEPECGTRGSYTPDEARKAER
jgi:agmatine deiminase